jgi:Ca2+-transporting ATPase
VGMIDPPRPEVKDAIKVANRAGIDVIMITGDHKNTAMAIAKELNIIKSSEDMALSGLELDKLSDEEFKKLLPHVKVYARVSPENKVRIVEVWKDQHRIVAMTGDGVNDAPALKTANIGIAMGITGTEVSKGAADMVLTDDNFTTIVTAVEEGRGIYANIKKAIHFLLSCNIGEIVTIFLGTILGALIFSGAVTTLTAVQILWVNLVTDSLMAIAIGLEPKESDIMEDKPRDSRKSFFADGLGLKIGWQGIMLGLLSFAAFVIGFYIYPNTEGATGEALRTARIMNSSTMTFMVLAISQLFHALNVKSEKKSLFKTKFNKYLLWAFIASLALQLLTIVFPFTRNLFGLSNLNLVEWLIVFGLSITPLVVVETQKFISNMINKRKRAV